MYTEIEYDTVKHESDKDKWVPKSVIRDSYLFCDGEELHIKSWFVQKEGLEYYGI